MSYTGKISTSGNSDAIRLDKNLFKQHPEFKQQAIVRADVIAPGTMLLQLVEEPSSELDSDPMVTAFLAFIKDDAIKNPGNIKPVSAKQMERIRALTEGVIVTDDDDLG